jgi:hypothetical protein
MNAVGAIQRGNQRDPVQEKRDERDLVLRGQPRIHPVKLERVLPPVRRRGFHPAQEDTNAPSLRPLDDRRQVLLDGGNAHPAQAIVGAQRDDQDPDVVGEKRVEAAQPSGGRIAADSGVCDRPPQALAVDPAL